MVKTITWSATATSNDGLVASGGNSLMIPVNPPQEWFKKKTFKSASPVQIGELGQVTGHVAKWGSKHIGYLNRDVPVPRSKSGYSYFMNKKTLTAEGVELWTGVVVMDTVHPKIKGLAANEAATFYDKTGATFADVRVYEDEFGIQIAGALRPTVSEVQLRAIRGTDYSPDWRKIEGSLEMVALLAVNLSGFIVDGLVASAGALGLEEKDYIMPSSTNMTFTVDADGDVAEMFGTLPTKLESESSEELSVADENTEVVAEFSESDPDDEESPEDDDLEFQTIEMSVELTVDPLTGEVQDVSIESVEFASSDETPVDINELIKELADLKEYVASLANSLELSKEIQDISLDD